MSKLKLFHNEIVNDYLNDGFSLRALSKKYGINGTIIRAHFVATGVPLKKYGSIKPHIQEKLDDPVWLEEQYLRAKSSQAVGDALGVTKQCVLKYMKGHGIEIKKFNFHEPTGVDIIVEDVHYSNSLSPVTTTSGHKYVKSPRNKQLACKEWLLAIYKRTMNAGVIADELSVNRQTVLNALHHHDIPIVRSGNTSLNETLLMSRLSDLNPIQSYRLDSIELDIFLPEYNVAIELHGYRRHSELAGGKGRNYHQNKYDVCQKNGIFLYQFWDEEAGAQTDTIVSMVRARCGKSTKVNARSCTVVKGLDVRDFLRDNHIQGSANYGESVSLVIDDEIMATMTFIKPRNKQYDWELNRFACKSGLAVRGAFSRLLHHGVTGKVVSYSDCRYSDGGVYETNGFKHTRTNGQVYYYTNDYKSIKGRMNFSKSEIARKFPDQYDEQKTEWENMRALGYDRLWSCKTKTWLKIIIG